MNENNKNKKDLAILISCIVLLFLGCLGFFSARWYITEFGDTGFDSILYTLFSEMSGTDSAVIRNYMLTALLPALVSFVVLTLFFWAKRGNGEKIYPFTKKRARIISLVLSGVMLLSAGPSSGGRQQTAAVPHTGESKRSHSGNSGTRQRQSLHHVSPRDRTERKNH